MNATSQPLMGKLMIDTAMGSFLGDKRIRLLEAIAQHGSILQAAKAVPMAYKAAWDAVDDMNNVAPEPLVLRATGGRNGGGSELTAFGRRLIAFYRALEQESQAALARLGQHLPLMPPHPPAPRGKPPRDLRRQRWDGRVGPRCGRVHVNRRAARQPLPSLRAQHRRSAASRCSA